MWQDQLKEYAIEENGFRTMLEELAVDRKKESNKKEEKVLIEWFKVIFGVFDLRTTLFYSSIDEFIGIRYVKWLHFCCTVFICMNNYHVYFSCPTDTIGTNTSYKTVILA
jgi:hypothetical protein